MVITVNPAVAGLAEDLARDVDALSARLVDRIVDQMDVYAEGSVVTRAQLYASVRDNLGFMLEQLQHSSPPDLTAPRRTGRERAVQGAPLPEMLRAFRLAFEFLWLELLAASRRTGTTVETALVDAASVIWTLVDDYCQAATEAYREVLAEQELAADRRRAAFTCALLEGSASGERGPWELAQLLRLPYEGRFVVVVAETPHLTDAALPRIESALQVLGATSAWYSRPGLDVGVLSCGPLPLPDLHVLLESRATAGVGLSPEFTRLDRAPAAHRRARIALESLSPGWGVRQFDDTALTELVIGNVETTRAVTRRVLGPVLELPTEDRDLFIDTAEAWLDAQGSASRAARALYCHENTVRHRLRRLERYIGRSLDDPRMVAELAAAIAAVRTFPDLVDSARSRQASPRAGGATWSPR